jgi:hypothetical protein
VQREVFILTRQDGLKWYRSLSDDTPNVHRGFCKECGSSLFWDPKGIGDTIAISAGTLDEPTDLTTLGHVWVSEAGDYYEITDGLPTFDKSHEGQLG